MTTTVKPSELAARYQEIQRAGQPDHSVVWDHSRCWHVDEINSDEGPDVCDPVGLWTCEAPAGSYCVFGCDVCGEDGGGWSFGDDDEHCSNDAVLMAHECWVLPWVEALDASDTYAGEVTRHHDGPIVVQEWDGDSLTWVYPEEWLPAKSGKEEER